MTYYIAIDPGLSGAICVLPPNGQPIIHDAPTFTAPSGKKDFHLPFMADLLRPYKGQEVIALIENVHAMPGQGGVSNFTFGRGRGIWEGMLAAFCYKTRLVTPQTWKKDYPELLPPPRKRKEKGDETPKKEGRLTKAEKEAAAELKRASDREKRLAKAAAKAKARELASKIRPDLADKFEQVNHDGRAEALLMALYAQKHFKEN